MDTLPQKDVTYPLDPMSSPLVRVRKTKSFGNARSPECVSRLPTDRSIGHSRNFAMACNLQMQPESPLTKVQAQTGISRLPPAMMKLSYRV